MEHYKQEKDYTCGPAVTRMVMSHFDNSVPDESDLELQLLTTPTSGTDPKNIAKFLRKQGYWTRRSQNATLAEVHSLHQDGWVVVLEVSVDVPHYTVYGGNNGNHLKLMDPYFGVIHFPMKKFQSDKNLHPHLRWRIVPKEFSGLPYDFTGKDSRKAYTAYKK